MNKISFIYTLSTLSIVIINKKNISLKSKFKLTISKFYRTNTYNLVLDIIFQQTNELRGNEKRESSDFSEKSLWVALRGIEPLF